VYDKTAAWVNGVELSNAWRSYGYIQGVRDFGQWDGDCEPWVSWGNACWQDKPATPYATPAGDPAPWYDSSDPASAEFLGLWIENMEGLDEPTETRTLAQRITTGSATSRQASPGREVVITATMFATSSEGMEFGQRWLSQILINPDECAGAKGSFVFRAACPPRAVGLDPNALLRYLVNVSLLKAPKYTSIHADADSTCDAYFQGVTFTLGSETADVFGYPLPGIGFTNQPLIYGSRQPCVTGACCDPLRDSGRFQWRSAYYPGLTGVGAVPVITIATAAGPPLYRYRITVISDTVGSGCVDQSPMSGTYQCADPITQFEVNGMPPSGVLVLSGVDGQATFYPTGMGGPSVDGSPYVNPLRSRGVAGLADTRGPVCVLGAATDLVSSNNAGVWSVQFQPRYRQG
jgi:hypothetical protein